jgi:hypothetical protein
MLEIDEWKDGGEVGRISIEEERSEDSEAKMRG